MIPYGKQEITQEDIDSVTEVLKSDFLTQGPKVPAFEESIKAYTSAKNALAFNSATSALHVGCLALDLGPGDILWTTPISFVASANCGLYCGAQVDFVDIDPRTYNLCPLKLEEKLSKAQKTGKLPKVVVAVHLCGQSCDMEKIHALSVIYGFKIIEDASHSIGGKYKNKIIGSNYYSDITIFSFHPVKIVTTGEGGVLTTNCSDIARKAALLRSHGITRDIDLFTEESHGPWYYEQIDLGFNYRMTELQAALGVSQMQKLDDFVAQRNILAKEYNKNLSQFPLTLPYQLEDTYSGLHLYVIRLKLGEIDKTHKEVFLELRQKGIGVNLHYIPIHTQPYYKKMGFKQGDFPEAETYYSEAISIPMFHHLTTKQLNEVISALGETLGC